MTTMIQDGQAVTLDYRLTLPDGTLIEDSSGGEQMVYVHGSQEILPGLERGLAGMAVGDERQIVVEPEDGYGPRHPGRSKVVDRSQFPGGIEIAAGMSFQAQSADGVARVWVSKVDGDEIELDGNHPLAGKTLVFDVRVLDVSDPPPADAEPPST